MSLKKTPLSLLSSVERINKLSQDSTLFTISQQSKILDAVQILLNVISESVISSNISKHD